jgi:phage-related holin
MGKGKDTAPVQLLLVVIIINFLLGVSLLAAVYQKYIKAYFNYIRLTDVMMLLIGIILTISLYKIYRDYSKLIKKHEPGR